MQNIVAALLVCCCEMMSQVKVSQWVHAIPCHACAVVWEVSAESTSDRERSEKTPFLFSIGARNPREPARTVLFSAFEQASEWAALLPYQKRFHKQKEGVCILN